jgi:biopolymer transport protein ExbB/TolQ
VNALAYIENLRYADRLKRIRFSSASKNRFQTSQKERDITMDIVNALLGYFQTGGPFMIPIAIVFAVGLIISLERWLYLSKAKLDNRRAFKKIQPMLAEKQYQQLYDFVRSSSAHVSRLILSGMASLGGTNQKEDILYAMQEASMECVPRLEKRTNYLSTLANVATLLGLLGTIVGLIAAFTAVADADPATKATLLSQSISIAMNTTAFGLISAIPLLLLHSMLQSKTTQVIEGLDIACVKFINSVMAKPNVKNNSNNESKAA